MKADEEVKPRRARPPLGGGDLTRESVVAMTPAGNVAFNGGRPGRRKSAAK